MSELPLSTLIENQHQIVRKVQDVFLKMEGDYDPDSLRSLSQSMAVAVDKLATLMALR